MNKNKIFNIVKKNIMEVMEDVNVDMITIDRSLKELGANSIDRVEIVVMTLEDLGINVSSTELGKVENIRQLVDFLFEKIN